MTDKPDGFVALKALKQGAPEPREAIAEIRTIYFRTTKKTIEHDIAHAIELLKSLPDEEARDRAGVFMEGLAEMRKEWGAVADRKHREAIKAVKGRKSKVKGKR